MAERLTDEELLLIERRAAEMDVTYQRTARAMRDAVTELRERRAADLTAEEREALAWLVKHVNATTMPGVHDRGHRRAR